METSEEIQHQPFEKDGGGSGVVLGMQVNIKRTDGRVHGAVVSGINLGSKSVTVEWFEKNETKGKEIDLNSLVDLNPQCRPPATSRYPTAPPTTAVIRNNSDQNALVIEQLTNMNNIMDGSTSGGGLIGGSGSVPKRSMVPVQSEIGSNNTSGGGMQPPAAQISKSNIHQSSNNQGATIGNNHAGSTANKVSKLVQPRATIIPSKIATIQPHITSSVSAPPTAISQPSTELSEDDTQMDINGSGGTVGRGEMNGNSREPPSSRRRSNVVKEVEKLKKNREERRVRQAEMKTEKEILMNLDPGNPNWEFLSMIREYRQTLAEINPLRESDAVVDHQITVSVRKRPMNKKELNRKEVDVITVPNKNQITVHEPKQKVDLTKYLENQHFRFDYAFDDFCNNEMVYKYTAKPLVQTVFEGGMATCFAYGQTGSGKTHTMGGDFNGKTQDCQKGIYALTTKDVFRLLKSSNYRSLNLGVSCSFFEIYSGKVFDLLANKTKLRVLEDGRQQVQVVGLTEKKVECVEDVLKLIQQGNVARTSGQTSANSNSSRSHAVFQIILRTPPGRLHGKFSLIDLAGNERGADTSSSDRNTRMEGAEINKSLLALKECIRALGRKGGHLPFRVSKLTLVLRDSFIGEKSRTCMIAMISPGLSSCEHTLNTLRYADRVKELTAHDPTVERMNMITEDDDNDAMEDDNELVQLRSINNLEMSGEMLTFHEAISAVQEAEEEMVEYHRVVCDSLSRWSTLDMSLLSLTNQVECDTETYAKRLEDLNGEKLRMLTELQNKVVKFRTLLADEEKLSKRMSNSSNPAGNRR